MSRDYAATMSELRRINTEAITMTETTTKPAKKAAAKKTETAASSTANKTRNKAYSAATGRLRDAHRDEFEDLLADECARLGVEYHRRLSAAEKAKQQINKLLEEHPELTSQFVVPVDAEGYPTGGEPVDDLPVPVGEGDPGRAGFALDTSA